MRHVYTTLLTVTLGCIAPDHADAYPGLLLYCERWLAGQMGYMRAAFMADGALDGACEINISSVLGSRLLEGNTYSITVSSSSPSLFKLHSSDGQCMGDDYSPSGMSRWKSFSWVAPAKQTRAGGASLSFFAVCSTGFDAIAAATPVRIGTTGGIVESDTHRMGDSISHNSSDHFNQSRRIRKSNHSSNASQFDVAQNVFHGEKATHGKVGRLDRATELVAEPRVGDDGHTNLSNEVIGLVIACLFASVAAVVAMRSHARSRCFSETIMENPMLME